MANIPSLPFPLAQLYTPAFCVDKKRLENNCTKMINIAQDHGCVLRPHMKTAKTIEAGILMTGGTKRRVVVSTLKEAEFYADAGFDDILYGYPLGAEKIPRCLALANRLDKFHVLTDNEIIIDALSKYTNPKGWSVFIKVDCGNNRAGIWHEDVDIGVSVLQKLVNANIRFAGFYVHCGDSYKAEMPDVPRVAERTIERLHKFANTVKEVTNVDCPCLAIGSTPACSRPIDKMKTVVEMHPGNYVFYDAQQHSLGSCEVEEIACSVATRVIGHYPRRNQMLVDCGFAALTMQGMGKLPGGCVIFKDNPDLKLVDMTQEIGKVTTVDGTGKVKSGDEKIQLDKKYPLGTMLYMYPWHSCATAALHPQYFIIENDQVVDMWEPCRGW